MNRLGERKAAKRKKSLQGGRLSCGRTMCGSGLRAYSSIITRCIGKCSTTVTHTRLQMIRMKMRHAKAPPGMMTRQMLVSAHLLRSMSLKAD